MNQDELRKHYIEHHLIDANPDGGYALRILRNYREHCNVGWTDVLGGEPTNPLCVAMNEINEKRKVELDKAISILVEAAREG